MTKTEQLLIRACKSKNGIKRVQSVIRRFYLIQGEEFENHQATVILTEICEKYKTVSVTSLIDKLHPQSFCFSNIADYWERCKLILISSVRLSSVDKFPGLTAPAMFKKKICTQN